MMMIGEVRLALLIFLRLQFLEHFYIHSKTERKIEFSYIPFLRKRTASLIISVPHQSGTFVTVDEPSGTRHCYPKSIVYITVHSGRCTFYGFGQRHHDIHPSAEYLQNIFIVLKSLCALPVHPSPPSPPATTGIFCLYSFAFSRMSRSWNHMVGRLLRVPSFT